MDNLTTTWMEFCKDHEEGDKCGEYRTATATVTKPRNPWECDTNDNMSESLRRVLIVIVV